MNVFGNEKCHQENKSKVKVKVKKKANIQMKSNFEYKRVKIKDVQCSSWKVQVICFFFGALTREGWKRQ